MKAVSIGTLLLVCQLTLVSSVHADSALQGRVGMSGSIVDSACAIDIGSYEQAVDMGVLPVGTIRQQGQGPIRPFSISLVDCRLLSHDKTGWQSFSVTFDGPAAGDWFILSGDASGVALSLLDANGQPIYPGQMTSRQAIVAGDTTLHYGLRLVSDAQPLHPGEYQSSLRFKLDYH